MLIARFDQRISHPNTADRSAVFVVVGIATQVRTLLPSGALVPAPSMVLRMTHGAWAGMVASGRHPCSMQGFIDC
ncbi:hypothetical protein [Xanthomonas arboricola]|uniref:hypothetical protein n=1 Tax=Xanthomonas arboricola TaxID=56448 RepID=UPI001290324B|nr:hypothetical protein [Xanthomonas arboricola]